jgi:hypothetical protein
MNTCLLLAIICIITPAFLAIDVILISTTVVCVKTSTTL